jgi:DNA-binding response OmpR family regulator
LNHWIHFGSWIGFELKAPLPTRVAQNNWRAAVVEHHDRLRESIVQTLQRHTGNAVLALHSWDAFCDEVAAPDLDVLVLDLDLPEFGGLAACRAARQRHPNACLIAMSAAARTADRIAALDAGADQLLSKPLSGEELMADIRRLHVRRGAGHPTIF